MQFWSKRLRRNDMITLSLTFRLDRIVGKSNGAKGGNALRNAYSS